MIRDIVRSWSEKIGKRKSPAQTHRRRQTRIPSGNRHAQRQSTGRQRSIVSRWRLFRSPRSAADPLRNGAAASRRERASGQRGAAVRGLGADRLPSAGGLQSRWAGCFAAAAAGAEARAQADAGRPLAYRAVPARAAQLAGGRSATRVAAQIWPHSSSPKPRAVARWQKKTFEPVKPMDWAGDVVGYEKLRDCALSGTTAQGSAAGSGMLLRHGLAAWLSTPSSKPSVPTLDKPNSKPFSSLLPAALASIILRLTKEAGYA